MNHPDIHRQVHAVRAAELQARAQARELARAAIVKRRQERPTPLRGHLGWLLVEAGLRLLQSRPSGSTAACEVMTAPTDRIPPNFPPKQLT